MADVVSGKGVSTKDGRSFLDRSYSTRAFFQQLLLMQQWVNSDDQTLDECIESVTSDEIIQSVTFRREHPDFVYNETSGISLDETLEQGSYHSASERARLSLGIERFSEKYEGKIRYDFGESDIKTGGADCSGYVLAALRNIDPSLAAAFGRSSENIVAGAAQKDGGFIVKGKAASEVDPSLFKEGMVIGVDSGKTKFDGGRQYGIDHVLLVYRDSETGELMVSECRGGVGSDISTLENWLKVAEKNKATTEDDYRLYLADLVPQEEAPSVAVAPQPAPAPVVAATGPASVQEEVASTAESTLADAVQVAQDLANRAAAFVSALKPFA